jgi:hypothetical protein
MPTGFPRAIVYDPMARCHVTIVVRRDLGYISYWCAEHGTDERYPLDCVSSLCDWLKVQSDLQVVSWIEVTDDGL